MLPAAHTRSITPRSRIQTTPGSLPTRPMARASVVLLRSVMDDRWHADEASARLLSEVHGDRPLLRLLRARLSRAMLERPTPTTERALTTLDRALSPLLTVLHRPDY